MNGAQSDKDKLNVKIKQMEEEIKELTVRDEEHKKVLYF